MPVKGATLSSSPRKLFFPWSSSPLHQWRFPVLAALVFALMVVVWSIDGCTIKSFFESWRLNANFKMSQRFNSSSSFGIPFSAPNEVVPNTTHQQNLDSHTTHQQNLKSNSTHQQIRDLNTTQKRIKWISAEMDPRFTDDLMRNWLAPGGEACRDSKTVEISVPRLDGRDSIALSTGEIHEIQFQALDNSSKPVCIGGDYFETDLTGENWKSRPPIKDYGNGSYSVSLQIHPDFPGDYNFTINLLFRHFEGLKFSPVRFAFNRELCRIPIKFVASNATLPRLQTCKGSDFTKDVWSGRWTRHGKNDDCEISNDGRYRCLPSDYPCRSPWCDGSLGVLESNGWVYSSHCSYKLFSGDLAWECLKNRWIFFWGDSNHVDSIRNMLNFVLGLPEIRSVPRRFDEKFSNPKDPSETVRITSIFNGHWNETQNYQGLDSLKDEGFRNLLRKYFSEETVPDTMIVNSGLHDGIHFSNVRAFVKGADNAASFWKGVFDSVKKRGLKEPKIIYRNTIATGGYARELAFNPSKMEAFNGILLERLKKAGLVSKVIDNFDMTFPWHFDNRCSDGVHYGRAPAKMRWRDGEIGHQYFVDIMLIHVLLNALCGQ